MYYFTISNDIFVGPDDLSTCWEIRTPYWTVRSISYFSGRPAGFGGTFAINSFDLKFGGTLYATRGSYSFWGHWRSWTSSVFSL